MVLAQKVGRKRSFVAGLLLTLVTFGIYAVYWNYRAHNELYRQFELARESRDEGMVWYVLGLVVPPFLLAYIWVFASNVTYLRDRIGLARRATPGRLLLILALGVGALAVAIIVLEAATVAEAGGGEATTEDVEAAFRSVGAVFVLLLIAAVVALPAGYAMLQRDINELWDAYDTRMAYLARHPEAFAQRPAFMGELTPTATTSTLALPIRAEVEALRAKHADLRALDELDALLARAEAGDADARERAEVLVGDVAQVLLERQQLLRTVADVQSERASIQERIAAGTIYEEDLRRRLAELDASDADERLAMLESALFKR